MRYRISNGEIRTSSNGPQAWNREVPSRRRTRGSREYPLQIYSQICLRLLALPPTNTVLVSCLFLHSKRAQVHLSTYLVEFATAFVEESLRWVTRFSCIK